jgi:hypothetical protein
LKLLHNITISYNKITQLEISELTKVIKLIKNYKLNIMYYHIVSEWHLNIKSNKIIVIFIGLVLFFLIYEKCESNGYTSF